MKWQVARQHAKDQILNLVAEDPKLSLSMAKDQLYEYTRLCMRHQLKAWLHDAANRGRPVEIPSEGAPLASAAPSTDGAHEAVALRRRLPQITPMIVR